MSGTMIIGSLESVDGNKYLKHLFKLKESKNL